MKVIEILLENGVSIVCKDDDVSEMISFTEQLTSILSSKKVSILSTSDGSTLILKPSKILSIKITEEVSPVPKRQSRKKTIQLEKQKGEDYISDG